MRRRSGFLALVGITLLGLAACSSGASLTTVGDGTGRGPGAEAPIPAATAAPAAAPFAPTPAENGSSGSGGTGSDSDVTPIDALIVRTGSLNLEVQDLDATLLNARGRIVGLGGYVSDSERANKGEDDAMALITYRIPSARWDEALDALRGMASKVVAENTKAVEVTGQVIDLGARIDNLRATERALQAIMVQATRIPDILEVQNQLSNVQGQIEQLTAQKNHLTDQASFGTLAVSYALPLAPPVTLASKGFDLGAEINRAFAQLVTLGQGLAVVGVWLLIVGLPMLAGVLLLAGIILFGVRRLGTSGGWGRGAPPPASVSER